MDKYLQPVLEGKSTATKKSYTDILNTCLRVTGCSDSFRLLIGRNNTFQKLVQTWPNIATRKKALSLLCTIARTTPDMILEALLKYWQQRVSDANKDLRIQRANKAAPAELEAMWIDYDSILAKVHQLIAQGNEHANLKVSKQLVVLAIYAFLPPKNRDFGKVRIVHSMDTLSADENGMVVPAHQGECKLVLNVYQTASAYGQFVEALPAQLEAILRASLETFPRKYLIVGAGLARDKFMADETYGTFVTDTMDTHFDLRLTTGDLRRLYIKQKVQSPSADVAASMLHSLEAQQAQIRAP